MELINNLSTADTNLWFNVWFDSAHYHRLYSNRNEKQASDFVEALVNELKPVPGALMLDLGCGTGRHCRALASMGYNVTGLDLSFNSIREAKKSETNSLLSAA